MNATRKPKATEPTTQPTPPEPPRATDILAGFRRRADRMTKQFEEDRAKFAASVATSPDLCDTIQWPTRELVRAQVEAQIKEKVVTDLTNPDAGATFRDRLGLVVRYARYEAGSIVSCQSWDRNSTNPVANALESAKVNARLRTWTEVAEECNCYLDGEIVEDIDEAGTDSASETQP